MTIDEKITHLKETVMTEARAEGNAIATQHREALETLLKKHEEEAGRQSEIQIKSETTKAKRQLNQAAAKAQTELKRALGKCQNELKAQLFAEVKEMLLDYRTTDEYEEYLCRCITQAAMFANGEAMTIYITPADAGRKERLESLTGMSITISDYDFLGGVRTVIHERNILIDRSFQAAIESEYQKFRFGAGGVGSV